MKRHVVILWLIVLPFPGSGQAANPSIVAMLNAISPDSLRRNVERLSAFGTRHTLSDTVSHTRGIGAARRWLASEFRRYSAISGGRMDVRFQEAIVPPSGRVPKPASIINVLATLSPKREMSLASSRVLIVAAHYDTRASDVMDAVSDAPGANDDGSGTAVVLELARVFAGRTFDATIVFACFAGEEQGLLGAGALAEMAKAEGWNVEAMLNNDMVGNTTGGDGVVDRASLRVFSQALAPGDSGMKLRQINTLGLTNDGPSRNLARYVEQVGEQYIAGFDVRQIHRLDRFLRGGDHRPFHERGFAAVRLCEARENYDRQHQNIRTENGREYGDLPKFVDYEYMTLAARVNAAVLASLAWSPAPPSQVLMQATSLGYETVLRWNRNFESDLAGYRIVYRETSAPSWQRRFELTDTTATLKILKDDTIFGVQAVDKEGNASLPVIPGVRSR